MVTHHHGNVVAAWRELDAPAWPDEAGWRALRAAATLDPPEPPLDLPPDGAVEVELDLLMPEGRPGPPGPSVTPAGTGRSGMHGYHRDPVDLALRRWSG